MGRHRPHPLVLGLTAALAIGFAAGVAAADTDMPDYAEEQRAIAAFQAIDQKLQDTGWRLARGNADFCAIVAPSIGLQLQDTASYGRPDIARAALGLTGDFAVQTAARGSPAALSGQFPANREVTRLVRLDPNRLEAGERLDWQRLKRVHDHIESLLRSTGAVEVGFSDGSSAFVESVPVCATRFELAGDNARAVADGERVVIGMRFEGFSYSEELLAAAIAHELAHNLLRHRAWLDKNGRKRRHVRDTEREADRLMPWLLANAGYDPSAAARFLALYKPNSGSALFIPGSHDKWQDRVARVEGELPQIAALMEAGGKADWSAHFRREIDAN